MAIIPWTNIDRVKRLIDKTQPDDDAILTALIEEFSSAFEIMIRRHVEKKERTEYYDAEAGQTTLILKGYPIDTGETFEIYNDTARDFGSSSLISSDSYSISQNTGLITFDRITLYDGPGVVKVVYTGGIAENTNDIIGNTNVENAILLAQAVEFQVAHIYQRRRALGSNTVSGGGGSVTVDDPTKLLPIVKRNLALFERSHEADEPL